MLDITGDLPLEEGLKDGSECNQNKRTSQLSSTLLPGADSQRALELARRLGPSVSEGVSSSLFSGRTTLDQFYLYNTGQQPLAQSEIVIKVFDKISVRVTVDSVTTGGKWRYAWGGEHSLMAFTPRISEDGRQIGRNVNMWGRGFSGAPAGEMYTLRKEGGRFLVVSPFAGDSELYPAMHLQIPKITGCTVENRGSAKSDNTPLPVMHPYAVFTVVIGLEKPGGYSIVLERNVLVYPGFTLLAERETTEGLPSDCSAAHWEDRLCIIEGRVTRKGIEQKVSNYSTKYISYSAYPAELLAFSSTDKGGELRSALGLSGFAVDFYELVNNVISGNSKLR